MCTITHLTDLEFHNFSEVISRTSVKTGIARQGSETSKMGGQRREGDREKDERGGREVSEWREFRGNICSVA